MAKQSWAVLPQGQESRIRELLSDAIATDPNALKERSPILYNNKMHVAFETNEAAAKILYQDKKRYGAAYLILHKSGSQWRMWQNGVRGAQGIHRKPFTGTGVTPVRT